jgi:hypothetical protein
LYGDFDPNEVDIPDSTIPSSGLHLVGLGVGNGGLADTRDLRRLTPAP